MGISVEGQKCPVCNAYLFDNDDVVFCPECGAPHHRGCFASIGQCAYKEFHGTDKEYRRPESKPEQDNSNNAPKAEYKVIDSPDANSTVCATCKSVFDKNLSVCPHCGTPKGYQTTPFGTPLIMIDAFGGVAKDEVIDGVSATDLKDYVAVNTQRYLPRFKKLNKKNKGSWNWGAFLFPHAWFFYRKIYLPGLFFFLMSFLFSLMASSINLVLSSAPEEIFKSYAVMYQYIADNLATFDKGIVIISIIGLLGGLVLRIISGAFGDWFYRKSAIESIKKVKENDDQNLDIPLALRLRKKGAVNSFLGLIGLFALQWLVQIVYILL